MTTHTRPTPATTAPSGRGWSLLVPALVAASASVLLLVQLTNPLLGLRTGPVRRAGLLGG